MDGEKEQGSSGENPEETEYVALHEAADEDIDAYLKKVEAEMTDLAQAPEEEGDDDASPIDSDEEVPDEKEEEKEAETPKSQEEHTKEELEAKLAQNEKRLKQVEEFVQRRNTEVGNLRKQIRELSATLRERIDENVDPKEVVEDTLKLKALEAKDQELESEVANLNKQHSAAQMLEKFAPGWTGLVDEMANTMAEDGIDERAVQAFKSNPLSFAHGETLVVLANRAKERQALRQLFAITKKVVEENRKLKGKPHRVIEGVEKALKQIPSINGKLPGGSQGMDRIRRIDPTRMSDSELDEYLKRSVRR